MFLHTRANGGVDAKRVPGKAKVVGPEPNKHIDDQSDNGHSAPRKRQKLSPDPTTVSSSATSCSTAAKETTTSVTPSIKRPVSPPRLKKVVPKNISKPAAVPSKISSTNKVRTPAKTDEVEHLNPRLLQSAPVSHDLRYKLLKLLHEQFVRLNAELRKDASNEEERLLLSDQQLVKMALDFEERTAIGKAAIYSQVVKNAVMMYKRMSIKDWKAARVAEQAHLQAKDTKPIKTAVPDPSQPIETGLSLAQEHAFLSRILTPIHHLTQHGYVVSKPNLTEIAQAMAGVKAAGGWEECDRCASRFRVFPGRREEDGALTSGESCTYHWGKSRLQDKDPMDPKAKRSKKFKCCNQSLGESAGCITGPSHVFKITEPKRLASILQFEETPEMSSEHINQNIERKPAICIDGEMGYTVYGLELIRLTATSWPEGKEIFDVLVRPIGEILDLNSRWSGVWPKQFASAQPWGAKNDQTIATEITDNETQKSIPIVSSPAEARRLLYRYITPSTPIIGHGLENDLNALRLIHPTLIDTVLLYPHRAGLPIRQGLKALMMQHLGRSIQTANDTIRADNLDGYGGHDSKEDAIAAGELVRHKIKTQWERMRSQGWTMDDNGNLIGPTQV